MNPAEIETKQQEIAFRCESCNSSKEDVFILRDGRVICADCAELWERDSAKQN
jgi:Zn finger protein HypA/HybF involved in hydrogenase expression